MQYFNANLNRPTHVHPHRPDEAEIRSAFCGVVKGWRLRVKIKVQYFIFKMFFFTKLEDDWTTLLWHTVSKADQPVGRLRTLLWMWVSGRCTDLIFSRFHVWLYHHIAQLAVRDCTYSTVIASYRQERCSCNFTFRWLAFTDRGRVSLLMQQEGFSCSEGSFTDCGSVCVSKPQHCNVWIGGGWRLSSASPEVCAAVSADANVLSYGDIDLLLVCSDGHGCTIVLRSFCALWSLQCESENSLACVFIECLLFLSHTER